MKSKYTRDQLARLAKDSLSMADMLRALGLKISGGSHRYIRQLLAFYQISTDHFSGQRWSKGRILGEGFYGTVTPLSEILVDGSMYNNCRLKHRLIKAGLKDAACEICLSTTWREKPIPLELHHANGKHTDNRIENLQIVCPNCHAQITIVARC